MRLINLVSRNWPHLVLTTHDYIHALHNFLYLYSKGAFNSAAHLRSTQNESLQQFSSRAPYPSKACNYNEKNKTSYLFRFLTMH